MLTCLCDAFYGEVGIATVKVLEHVGCEVAFEERQTCCGQPPFNAGDWKNSEAMARNCVDVFRGAEAVVVPSASCAAMMHEGYPMMGVEATPKVYELSQFLLKVRAVEKWPALASPKSCAFHRSCHGRMLRLENSQLDLLRLVGNLEIYELPDADQCCGFGGAFSVTHGSTSVGIGTAKLARIGETGADLLVGGDMGCLMHLTTLAKKLGDDVRALHYVQILAEAL